MLAFLPQKKINKFPPKIHRIYDKTNGFSQGDAETQPPGMEHFVKCAN